MQELKWYATVARLPWLGYRSKILLCVATAVVPGWSVALLWGSGAAVTTIAFGAAAAAMLTSLAVLSIVQLLRPIGRVAAVLREPIRLETAAELPTKYKDEVGAIMAGVRDLAARVSGLHHRWIQRHPLTGLPTREYLILQIGEDLSEEPSERLLGAIRFADYDRLAAFDLASADEALKMFAERLSAAIGKDRPLAHVDRDCFAIWFRNAAEAQIAASELQVISYTLGAEIQAGALKIVPDIEVGAAVYPRDGSDPTALVTRALVSLARPGQGNVAAANGNGATKKAREDFELEQDLRQAIARDQFELHFQPVVDLTTARLVGAEALLRWHHPTAGLIAPSKFVPMLEEAGLTDEIGMWTLNTACREARNWHRHGLAGLKVAVNLSATQLRDPQLKRMIVRTLERHKLSPQALELELTETMATEDADRTFALFSELKAMGISLAIDDFGSGYSSLSYVKNLPFNKLKIDREFVVKVHERRDSQAICRSLIELTRGLGIKLLAEGVEREEEVLLLRSFGCALFQGYYFSRPLTADDFIRRAQTSDWPELHVGSVQRAQQELKNRMTAS